MVAVQPLPQNPNDRHEPEYTYGAGRREQMTTVLHSTYRECADLHLRVHQFNHCNPEVTYFLWYKDITLAKGSLLDVLSSGAVQPDTTMSITAKHWRALPERVQDTLAQCMKRVFVFTL